MNTLNIQNFNYFGPTQILCAPKVIQGFQDDFKLTVVSEGKEIIFNFS